MKKENLQKQTSVKIPNTFVILFFLVLIVSILTWIIPPGEFQYEAVDVGGTMRNLVVPGSYQIVDKSQASPVGIIGFFSSFHKGLIAAAEVVMLIFLVNGAFSLVIKTGAIDAFLGKLLRKFHGREKILIPLFFMIFATGASLFGMLNEFNGLIPVFVGLGIALGYDAIVGLAIVGLGAYIGFAGSIMNPFTVVVAQTIAGIPLYSNSIFRVITFFIFCIISILWIFRYGAKVKKNPSYSFMKGLDVGVITSKDELAEYEMTGRHQMILFLILASLGLILWGSITKGWGAIQLTGVFIMMGIAAAIIDGWNADKIAEEFLAGCRAIVFGALVTGVARATLVVMEEGMIVDTIINSLASLLQNLPPMLSAQGMLFTQTLINFIIPSGSGQAATIIPIFAPIGDIVGLSREVVVLAFQFGDGLSNLLWPTCGVAIICGLAKVPLDRWWKFFLPLFGILYVVQMILLATAVFIGI